MDAERSKPRLIVLRGNAGSGKSTVARALCEAVTEPLAWVEQDYFRRIVLRENGGTPVPKWCGLIDGAVRYSLDAGYHVVLEGILDAQRHHALLTQLHCDYPGRTDFYYFDVPFDETVRRHATRAIANAFGESEMRDWFNENDRLDFIDESIIDAGSSAEQTVQRIVDENFPI